MVLHRMQEAFGPDLEFDATDLFAEHYERTVQTAAELGIHPDNLVVVSAAKLVREVSPRYKFRLRVGLATFVTGQVDRYHIGVLGESEAEFPEPEPVPAQQRPTGTSPVEAYRAWKWCFLVTKRAPAGTSPAPLPLSAVPLLPRSPSVPQSPAPRRGGGGDTSRYGHYACFLRDNLQPAAAELPFAESAASYQQLRQRLEPIVQ
jgi:hypothetical protein